jgi:hypothetical protein
MGMLLRAHFYFNIFLVKDCILGIEPSADIILYGSRARQDFDI